ncbi:MAG: glycosyltransferase family 4 protein [Planctomycetota bacterium]
MRVALVIDRFEPRRGGVEQWTWRFAEALARGGDEVLVVAKSFDPRYCDAVRPVPLPIISSRVATAAAAEEILRSLDADVIHDTGVGWYADVIQPHLGSRRAATRANLECLPAWRRPLRVASARWLPRDREFREIAARQFDGRPTDRGPKHILAVSEMVRRDLVRDYGLGPDSVRVIPHGIAPRRFDDPTGDRRQQIRHALGAGDDAVYLFVGHNYRLKGLGTLLISFANEIRTRGDGHLWVLGDRPAAAFRRQSRRLGIADRVKFLRYVPDTAPYFAAADVLVHPTRYDSYGLVIAEALAAGRPVVTTSRAGAAELIEPDRTGTVLDDPSDVPALSRAMQRALELSRDPDCRAAAAAAGRSRTFAENVAAIRDLYGEIAAARSGRRAA